MQRNKTEHKYKRVCKVRYRAEKNRRIGRKQTPLKTVHMDYGRRGRSWSIATENTTKYAESAR